MLIDTHAHLNDERLYPEIPEIVNNMAKDGLKGIINVGYDLKSSRISVELAEKHENIYAAVGVHPHDAKYYSDKARDYFIKAAENPKVVAIGEIGLDFHYDYSPRDVQKRVFAEQLQLAHSLNLPVIIHLREAYEEMYALLNENKELLTSGFVLHCYSGSAEMAARYDRFDPYYSFGGAITFAKHKDIVIKSIRKDRLLLETDCPYMTPAPFRGKLNRPAYVRYAGERMAEFLGVSSEEIEKITTENARRLFRRLA